MLFSFINLLSVLFPGQKSDVFNYVFFIIIILVKFRPQNEELVKLIQ